MKKIIYCFCLLGGLFTVQAGSSPYDAARHGDLQALRQYRFEGIDLFIPDERGFTPYELAALHADPDKPDSVRKHVETMLWLKEYQPEKHHYGKASISLVQAGLNALGYPVGKPDGLIGKKTTDTIKEFQKDNDLAPTGRLGPQWLGVFYQDILKDVQFKLTKLGYNTKGTDGLMGKNTSRAMQKYRQEHQLSNPDYPYLDTLLLTSVDNAYRNNEKKKQQAIAKQKQQAKENQMRFAQAGLRTLGYRIGKIDGMSGSKTSNAIKQFQKKYKLSVTGEIDSKTIAKMRVIFLKETQRKMKYLGYKLSKPDGKNGKQTSKALAHFHKNYNVSGYGLTAGLIAAVDNEFDSRMDKEASQKAKAKRKQKKTSQKKSKSKRITSKRSTSKATARAKIRKSNKSSSRTSSKKRVSNVATTSRRTTSVHGNRARGRMSFNRSGGRVVGCSISGRRIPIEWCEPFYPLPRNNHCEATFKPSSGAVINLWCK